MNPVFNIPNLLTILTASVTAGRGAGLLAGMGVHRGDDSERLGGCLTHK